ncbi:hypothetical protein syc0150_c [Synechococcus elongatus PCC 6301]|uniref:DUF192 domain-containing protein n=1 Tax=Synechococcus sp. (strain ATCC 27144 / PCC 6301 / SAUG 1402/1) TaxID=269084 RepID=A0A0H3K2G4_SYNP6|nr:DUF192 domain-containing protein [Synechococcus elongatus]BAD78340.1 hypothetical protein syc0150_c [Synechococcus elongatus PCC 6301]
MLVFLEQRWLQRLAIAVIPLSILGLSCRGQAESDRAQYLPIGAEVKIGGQRLEVEVAATPAQQARGLMFRPRLADNRGMIFPFSQARPVSFWMFNTPEPLDMIFLYQGEVRAIVREVPPCLAMPCPSYGPALVPIDAVIELRAGRSQELGLNRGDRLNVQFLQPVGQTVPTSQEP